MYSKDRMMHTTVPGMIHVILEVYENAKRVTTHLHMQLHTICISGGGKYTPMDKVYLWKSVYILLGNEVLRCS